MKAELKIKEVPFSELLNRYVSLYLKEYGEINLKDISNKIHESKTVKKFLNETNIVKKRPLRDDFLTLVHSIYHFTFAKADKIALASIIVLCKWEREVAIPNNLNDNDHLIDTFWDILEKSQGFKLNKYAPDEFFNKFIKIVMDELINQQFKDDYLIDETTVLELHFHFTQHFQKLSEDVEKEKFYEPLIDLNLDPDFDDEVFDLKQNFNKRFQISSGILCLAIIEYLLRDIYSEQTYGASLSLCKRSYFEIYRKIRMEILNLNNNDFDDDNEGELSLDNKTILHFSELISLKSKDIDSVVSGNKKCGNIYYHFYQALGQLLPSREGYYLSPEMCPKIETEINFLISLGRNFLHEQV